MNNALASAFMTVSHGLRSATLRRCSRWTETYRIMGNPFPGPWSFLHHPWTKEMHDNEGQECCGQKAAQMGFTETMLNRALFTIDQKRQDVLYVLPAKTPDATDFSNTRFDPALELSPYLSTLFTSVNNVSLKRAGANSLYIRGSRARSALKSVPAGLVILDEVEEFDEGAIPLVKERLSGQLSKQLWAISTPSIPNHGINERFSISDQRHFFFICPSCYKHVELTFPDSIVICGESENDPTTDNSYLICSSCKVTLPHQTKTDWLATGRWVPTRSNSSIAGYHVSQLYSPTITPGDLAKSYLSTLTSPVKEQEFYNSKLGLPHTPAGSTLTDEMLDACVSTFRMNDQKILQSQSGFFTMGVDVGTELHVVVTHWTLSQANNTTPAKTNDINAIARGRVMLATMRKNFEDLDNLLFLYRPVMTVVDQLPETRSAIAFAHRFPGRVKLCHYGNSLSTREIFDHGEHVTVDRTCWLDLTLSRFMNRSITLPVDIPLMFRQHIQALVRVPRKDKYDNVVYRYENTGPDHFAHASNYSEIALACSVSLGGNQTITERIR